MDPTTPLPPAKALAEDERSVLVGYLEYHRAVFVRKAEGISDDDARRAACPPSALSLLGMVRHLADVERWWFRRVHAGEDLPDLFSDDAEWDVPADATLADALAVWQEEVAAARSVVDRSSLDDRHAFDPGGGGGSLRRLLVHMIEEYARHCGHADLLREAIDGVTGD